MVVADPLIITSDERPVLLDEWQRFPTVWDVVRRIAVVPLALLGP